MVFKQELQQFKLRIGVEPPPSFNLIVQPGTLNFELAHGIDKRDIVWYVHQLRYYDGEDLSARFDALFSHSEGKQELLKEWAIFSFQPRNQQKILLEIIQNQRESLANVADNVDLIADEIAQEVIKAMFINGDAQIRQQLKRNYLCKEQRIFSLFLMSFMLTRDLRKMPIECLG